MRLRSILLAALAALAPAAAFADHLVAADAFSAIAGEYSGEAAQDWVRRLSDVHRIQGSAAMAALAEQAMLPALKAAGLEASIETFVSDGAQTYATFVSPMGWTLRSGELWITKAPGEKGDPVFRPQLVCRSAEVPLCVTAYSKGGEWQGELVDVGRGESEADYKGRSLRGKVALASGAADKVMRLAVLRHGAVGMVGYPADEDRPDHPDLLRFQGLWTRADQVARAAGGFQISHNQWARLRALLKRGPVTVRGSIDASLGDGALTVAHAVLRGSELPNEEVIVSAHFDHPKWSANDNASGAAALLEMARTLRELIHAGLVAAPRRTLHFLWVSEYFGTVAWALAHPEARRCGAWDDPRQKAPWKPGQPCVVADLTLDMVGEDQVKTGAQMLVARAPLSVPSFLDALLPDVLAQAGEANLSAPTGTRQRWDRAMSPYLQGSDHDVFLGLGIPAALFTHAPDWTHHSSEDKPDKTDATELKRVGVMAAAAAHWLASAKDEEYGALRPRQLAERLARTAEQMASEGPQQAAALAERLGALTQQLAAEARSPRKATPAELLAWSSPPQQGKGPRRLTLLPLEVTALDGLRGDDAQWIEEQRDRFRGFGFDRLLYEAINRMDGHRSSRQIAQSLAKDYGLDIEPEWMDLVVAALAKVKLVAPE